MSESNVMETEISIIEAENLSRIFEQDSRRFNRALQEEQEAKAK